MDKPIIFLDIDGVLNSETFFKQRNKQKESTNRLDFYKEQICPERLQWLNELCDDCQADVVISSSWRVGHTLEELLEILSYCGATFNIIGMTSRLGYERGIEIAEWLRTNTPNNFRNYAIIDDDSDMLLCQAPHYFATDNYTGLTPNVCYRIARFFGVKSRR